MSSKVNSEFIRVNGGSGTAHLARLASRRGSRPPEPGNRTNGQTLRNGLELSQCAPHGRPVSLLKALVCPMPPFTAPQYLRDGTRYDFEFLGTHSPQDAQLGAWEADLPPGVFGPEEVGTVSAWALDFSRGNFYYRLEGDHEL